MQIIQMQGAAFANEAEADLKPSESYIAAEMEKTGRNRNVIIQEYAARQVPASRLPAHVAKARSQAEAAQGKAEEADAKLRRAFDLQDTLDGRLAQAVILQGEIERGAALLAGNQADVESIPRHFEDWPALNDTKQPGHLSQTLDHLARCQWWVSFLPGWLERRRAALVVYERQTAEFKKENSL
jgi:hypothetical protein